MNNPSLIACEGYGRLVVGALTCFGCEEAAHEFVYCFALACEINVTQL